MGYGLNWDVNYIMLLTYNVSHFVTPHNVDYGSSFVSACYIVHV